eukprot:TRINITY_DN14505_c0_g2_i4.p1 TRINITY_DN14505_c0_g2~~TRINITY_DN14505_c0_g2_i4.p1  ORF type:complete len:330 (+),score=29.93 TRINITY_DN14505_c0_g2_i4:276-1265(+)
MNGVVNIGVLNALQGNADVSFVVRTWFEDMEFAVPLVMDDQSNGGVSSVSFANFVVQSGSGAEESILVKENTSKLSLLYAGESIPSLRVLLCRSQLWRIQYLQTQPTAAAQWLTFPRFPAPKGCVFWGNNKTDSVPNGNLDTFGANVTPNTGTFSGNGSNTTNLAYVAACFVGHRGSILWRAFPIDSSAQYGAHALARVDTTLGGYTYGVINQSLAYAASSSYYLAKAFGSGSGGMQLCTQFDRVLSGLFPSYLNSRMIGGNPVQYMRGTTVTSGGDIHRLGYEGIRVGRIGMATSVVFYNLTVAAGPDWNPLEFLSVPDVFTANVPTP